jgi:peptide/nickel transport system permease protein
MSRYVLIRLAQAVPVLLLVTFAAFSLILLLPGDPVTVMFSQGGAITPEQEQNLRRQLGLDRPIPEQYLLWLGHALTGDLGQSTGTRLPVTTILATSLPVSLQLGLFGLLLSLVIAIPAGIVSAVRPNSTWDRCVTLVTIGGVAVPDFFLAILLILVCASWLHLLPPTGFVSMASDPLQAIKFMLLPGVVLAFGLSPVTTRQIRSSLLEVLGQDYVRTAHAKGLPKRHVVVGHALRNAAAPALTVFGLLVGRLLAGQVVVEQIFGIPGMGRVLVGAILARDFPIVQAVVLLVALSVILANLATDLTYGVLDPRLRY